MKQPTPAEVKKSLIKWLGKNNVVFKPGWDKRGRSWSGGVRGVMVHDLVGVDQGAIDWTNAAGESMPYCNSVTTADGKVIINSVLSVWHSGAGGPWPKADVPKDQASYFIWGIEHAVWGKKLDEYTPAMVDATAKTVCAIREVAGDAWPKRYAWQRLVRHASWTDGGKELGLSYYLSTRGRKVDTLRDLVLWRKEARDCWDKGTKSV